MADKIRVKRIKARNAVVGDRGKVVDKSEVVIVSEEQSKLQKKALRQLKNFVELLSAYANEIDIEKVQEAANQADTALRKPRLRRDKIDKFLRSIMAAVSGIAALATAIGAVQATVARLLS